MTADIVDRLRAHTCWTRELIELAKELDRKFGARMRQERERQGISQQHVALVLEASYGFRWHQTTVGKVESGERPIKLAEAVAVAQTLGVPLDELVYEDANVKARLERVERAYQEVSVVRRFLDHRLAKLLSTATPSPRSAVSAERTPASPAPSTRPSAAATSTTPRSNRP